MFPHSRNSRRATGWRLLFVGLWLASGTAAAEFSVSDGRIVDADGQIIELRGVNWYGMDVGRRAVGGLHLRNYRAIIDEMVAAGFNAVRLPFCPGLAQMPPLPRDWYWINRNLNPGLYAANGDGLRPIEVLRRVVDELDRRGVYFLLDHHRDVCHLDQGFTIPPLWYSDHYSEQDWLDDLVAMARSFAGHRRFLGMDLKNEPHGAAQWGTGNRRLDWRLAAQRAGAAVLEAAPGSLVFVEGIAKNAHCNGDYEWWWSNWGGNLARQACEPIDLPADKLVFAPHVYGMTNGFLGVDTPYFFTTDARNARENPGRPADLRTAMPEVWDQFFGRLVEPGYGRQAVAIGEFGARNGRFHPTRDPLWYRADDSPAENLARKRATKKNRDRDQPWAEAIIGYLTEKGIHDSFWWALNGDGPIGGIYYGEQTPRPDGRVVPADQWTRMREDIVSPDPRQPGLLNRYWAKAACFDGLDNDRDGLSDEEDPQCQAALGLRPR